MIYVVINVGGIAGRDITLRTDIRFDTLIDVLIITVMCNAL